MLLEVPLRGAEVRMLVRYSRPLAAIVVLRVLTCVCFGMLAVGVLFNYKSKDYGIADGSWRAELQG